MSKIIALDYGDAKVGVAIGSPEVKIAHPKGIWRVSSHQEILDKLQEILQVGDVDKILVGNPVGLQGQETIQTNKVQEFVGWLKDKVNVPVEIVDERYSTQAAQRLIGEFDQKKTADEDVAAMIMLQSYFDAM